ncbi:MAG: DUF512 domain-containing protein [Candidatus Cloacimonadaceae bacterium]|jgi:putative radical SAM enzyme (TIGR03279 family)|nr:DUF512 domain-containing protein [Candidatus Cloacimonadota bacterium]MDY0127389.1 DUF512 domain-containing protein [Candidatus Cloacimonadaceae bacterium]MCB5254727.1 DUF512 domain-containing protein [Candidatus Cloacimonadota bacterium]MCK9178217.1 DUF512 domain-containing protein [Candidatus Cloacimonadota bacterium]MCK9241720.1 DUF512 domain-containing protein [Candidatus Cloacimonadota bacterium]
MSVQIKSIEPGSLAQEQGIQAQDKIISINGTQIRDFLDLQYYANDFQLDFILEDPSGCQRQITIYRELARPLGIIPQDYRHRNCQNNCIFCFIDQMPPGMRKSLYAKDDDYLLSFVYGNYITLTNLKEGDIKRISEQHISPLYVSLHSSNMDLRQELMRSARPVNVMAILTELSELGIDFHIQIVCVPGINDGIELKRTISDLMDKRLNILSIGVVPVGLTRYRDGLCTLDSFDQAGATGVLDTLDDLRTSYDSQIIYPADEFFVLARRSVPEVEYYQDFPQIENGIGMLSLAYQQFKKRKRAILKELRSKGGDFVMLCSQSAEAMIAQIVNELNLRLQGQKVTMQVIRNDFFGEQVTVTGLITFSDIAGQFIPKKQLSVILPDIIFNHEGYTLDGKTMEDIKKLLDSPIILMDQFLTNWQSFE